MEARQKIQNLEWGLIRSSDIPLDNHDCDVPLVAY